MGKVNIIGAGPSGSHLAYLLSVKGHEVNVFEENKVPGIPIQCTGLVSSSINKVIKVPNKLIKKKISKVIIYSPSGKSLDLSFKEPDIVLDRAAFDHHLYSQAKSAGARFFLGQRYIHSIQNSDELVSSIKSYETNKIKKFSSDYLIGADGPNSQVAKDHFMFGKRRFMFGVQARIKMKHKDAIEFFPHIGCLAWCVPESEDIARVGVVSYNLKSIDLHNFIKNKIKIKKPKLIDNQGGLIPIFNKNQIYSKNKVFLVGDAAGLVKATTGGGIIQGLTSAKLLSENIEAGDYNSSLRKELLPGLKFHLLLRNSLDKFKEKDWDKLIELCSDENVKEVLNSKKRDYPLELGIELLIKKPSFLLFARKLL